MMHQAIRIKSPPPWLLELIAQWRYEGLSFNAGVQQLLGQEAAKRKLVTMKELRGENS